MALNLTWSYRSFEQLTTTELYAILQARSEVFVVEQNCVYLDIDNKDQKSFHLTAWDGETIAAYCRVLPPGVSFPEASIGRVITPLNYRGLGIGLLLIEKAILYALESYQTDRIKIGAQLYLKKFYGSFGFEQKSEVYLEDGIEHIDMMLIRDTNS